MLKRVGVVVVVGLVACTDGAVLDTGDTVIVVAESGTVFAPALDGAGCRERGGSPIRVIGQRSDGTPARGAEVQLWLTGSPVAASLTVDSVTLSDNGTSEIACVVPGAFAGTSTLHARSGPVEATTTIETADRAVPPGGTLKLGASPIVSDAAIPASSCGVVQSGCFPGTGRTTQLSVLALPPAGKAVPERSEVTLATNAGALDCQAATIARLALVGNAASTRLCLPDLGGKVTVTAHSGTTSAMLELDVRTVPRGVVLVPDRAVAAVNTAVSYTAIVTDCEGRGVADVALLLRTTSGVFRPAEGTPAIPKTGADGSVTIAGTAVTLPLALRAEVVGAQQIECLATIGVQP
ncbi:MAG: hypothetical protein KIT31_33200 [Deltaproteobacteria bacterium]|nr:hypothetical protein [Deltaproteobacteria bacterium]